LFGPEKPAILALSSALIGYPCGSSAKLATRSVRIYPRRGNEKLTMSPDASPKPTLKLYSALIVLTSIAISAMLLVRLVLNFRHQYFLTHVEGVWLASAYDFIHGIFYRPLFSSLGYGGTRYFPLYFVLTGALSKPLGSLETAGIALSGAGVVVALAAVYTLLRRLRVSLLLSVAAVTSVLAVATTQQALLGAKGDSLAAALNLWGVVLCVGSTTRRIALYCAALLFTLAFATKITTVFGVGAVFVAWILARRYKEAIQLAVATACGYILVLLSMYVASGGRVFAIFRACAGGGGSLSYTLQAPLHLLSKALDVDPVFLLFLVPAAVFGLHYFHESRTDILPIYFVLVLLVTTIIFGSLGIGINHLFDLQIAAVLLLVTSISRAPGLAAPASTGLLAFALVVALVPTSQSLHGDLTRPSFPADTAEVLKRLPADERPVLAENPLIVINSNRAPYLLDPFMFRILAMKHPELAADFWGRMEHQGFAAIVLERDAATSEGKTWYTDTHFGGEFLRDLDAHYAFSFATTRSYVYTPKVVQP
jgi:hypothetical protein